LDKQLAEKIVKLKESESEITRLREKIREVEA